MLRLALSLVIIINLFACGSEQKKIVSEEITLEEIAPEFEPHAILATQKTSIPTQDNCTLIEPLYLTDRLEDLNTLSQLMFSLDGIEGVNGYANFITLAQLSLMSKTHTSDLIEQLGLSGITENNEWFNVFCYLENTTPTNTFSATIAEDWLIRDDLYGSLIQKFQANFTSKSIDPEKNLWRLSLANSWEIDMQLTIDDEISKYVHYQNTADAQNSVAHAIKITDNISSVSNEFGDYFSIANDSDFILHIIMPTFAQYPHVKSNIVDVLNGFKGLEKTPLNELYLPYFSEVKSNDNFMSFAGWLSENLTSTLLDDETQDYSGINQYETFKLINSYNSNSFGLNGEGNVNAYYSNTITAEALFYVEEAFTQTHGSIFTLFHGGNLTFQTCEEEVETESTWRPYFILIESTKNNLIYSIVTNGQPKIKPQNNICI